ncbi:MAG: transposase [Planctomycetota bacterium]
MPRPLRTDAAGEWHHLMNRGEAHQVIFVGAEDMRYFLSCVVRSVRRKEIEIHAYCILNNHFHLLARSPRGCVSTAMQRIQSRYVRWFNRRRTRDGSPLKGRFHSVRVQTQTYRRVLVSYIDDNPVNAGLAPHAEDYRFGSGHGYAQTRGPIWLNREWIETEAVRASEGRRFTYGLYRDRFPSQVPSGMREWIERRVMQERAWNDPLDAWITATPDQVQQWLQEHDSDALPLLPVDPLLGALSRRSALIRRCAPDLGRSHASTFQILSAGLLRGLCGLTIMEICARRGHCSTTVRRLIHRHRELLTSDREYAACAAAVTREALHLFPF